jgi:hypothetical protein
VEEPLDLRRVQVHRDHVPDPGRLQQVGHQARGDRLAAPVPLVRAGIAEVGHDGGDARRGGAAAGVGEGEQLNQVVVDGRRGRLHDEDFFAPHGHKEAHRQLAIGEPLHRAGAQRHIQVAGNRRGQ